MRVLSRSWLVGVAGLSLLLASCGGTSGPDGGGEAETVRVVTATGPGYSYFGTFVAKQLGFFEDEASRSRSPREGAVQTPLQT